MNMNYITTTDLRTKSSQLVNSLKNGESITLIHRSKIVGVFKPATESPKTFTEASIEKLKRLAKDLNLPQLSYQQRENAYRKYMMKKYGKDLS